MERFIETIKVLDGQFIIWKPTSEGQGTAAEAFSGSLSRIGRSGRMVVPAAMCSGW